MDQVYADRDVDCAQEFATVHTLLLREISTAGARSLTFMTSKSAEHFSATGCKTSPTGKSRRSWTAVHTVDFEYIYIYIYISFNLLFYYYFGDHMPNLVSNLSCNFWLILRGASAPLYQLLDKKRDERPIR